MFPGRRWRLQVLPVVLTLEILTVTLSELLDQFARLYWEEAWTRRPSAARGLCGASSVDISPVLSIDTLFAHCGKLPSLGHEHDDKGDGSTAHQSTGHTDILELDRSKEARQDPGDEDADCEVHGQADVHGLSVVLPHTPGLESQDDHHQDQEDDVEEAQELLLEGDVAGVVDLSCLGYGQLHLFSWGRHQPLDPNDELNQYGEAQEQTLVGGRQVDATVQGDEEDQLHQQSGVDYGVG